MTDDETHSLEEGEEEVKEESQIEEEKAEENK